MQPNVISVTFSQPIVRTTLTPSTFLVTFNSGVVSNVAGNITYDNTSSVSTLAATFTPTVAGVFGNIGSFTVTLIGTPPPAPIMDIYNQALDGDNNGQAGGNFTSSFSVFVELQ